MDDKFQRKMTDPLVVPDDKLIISLIGDRIRLWKDVLEYASSTFNDISGEWRYYNDGKQWLYKLTRKQKTIFWAAVADNLFRITFYFGDKAEEIILKSDIPEELKKGFSGHKGFGKIRPVTVHLLEPNDVENVYKLIKLKISIR